MEGSISYNDLGLILLFLVLLAGGAYFVVTLKNANRLIRDASDILAQKREHIHQTIDNLHRISEAGVGISQVAAKSVEQASKAIDIIAQDTTETVLTINKTADDIGSYAIVIGEIVKALTNLFLPDRK